MKISYRLQRKSKKIIRDYILKKEFIKSTKYGFKIKLDVKRDVDKHFYWGEFEVEILNFLLSILNSCSVFFDVGANIGIYTLMASRQLHKKGKVFAFEPSDWAYDRLNENIALNQMKNIETLKLAVSNFNGVKQFYVCDDDAYNSLISTPMRETKNKTEIECITIDNFCSGRNIKSIDVLKIDTEGADFFVLNGAVKILKSDIPPLVICEINKNVIKDFDKIKNQFIGFMSELDYDFFMIDNNVLVKVDMDKTDISEVICLKNYHIERFDLKIKA